MYICTVQVCMHTCFDLFQYLCMLYVCMDACMHVYIYIFVSRLIYTYICVRRCVRMCIPVSYTIVSGKTDSQFGSLTTVWATVRHRSLLPGGFLSNHDMPSVSFADQFPRLEWVGRGWNMKRY